MAPQPDNRPWLLCVDDEPNLLEGLRDALRRDFHVTVAESGEAGLALLRADNEAYAVVISDMRMPGMSGATFLGEARRVAPLAVRMLLTGYADTESAVRAVNDGRIFRFLTKPCGAEELRRACMAAVWHHRVVRSERMLLDQTLRGCVDALVDVLALASPIAYERGARVRRAVAGLAAEIGWEDAWEVETAAMFAQIGELGLPAETVDKLDTGAPLTPAEDAMAERVPAVAQQILAKIPRLEGVEEMLDQYARPFVDPASPEAPPVGARMLRIAVDHDVLQCRGASAPEALARMAGRAGVYDPELLAALARSSRQEGHA